MRFVIITGLSLIAMAINKDVDIGNPFTMFSSFYAILHDSIDLYRKLK